MTIQIKSLSRAYKIFVATKDRSKKPSWASPTSVHIENEALVSDIEDWLDNAYHNNELTGLNFSKMTEVAELLAPNLITWKNKSVDQSLAQLEGKAKTFHIYDGPTLDEVKKAVPLTTITKLREGLEK